MLIPWSLNREIKLKKIKKKHVLRLTIFNKGSFRKKLEYEENESA